MEGPPLGPGGEDITWPDQVAPRGRKASSTRKIKPQTSNATCVQQLTFCIGTSHIAINTTFSTINSIGCGRKHKIALHLPDFRRFAFIELLDPTRIQLFHTASLPVVLHQTLDENGASSSTQNAEKSPIPKFTK